MFGSLSFLITCQLLLASTTLGKKGLPVKRIVWVLLLILLGACQEKEEPLPTQMSQNDALATAGLLTNADRFATETAAHIPTITVVYTWTPTPTISRTPTDTLTPTITPSQTFTLSPIQETEIFLYQRSTSIAATATAQVLPTASSTPTKPPADSPTPAPTATETPILPDAPAPNRVIFTSNRLGTNDIWVMELDGSNPMPIVFAPESNEVVATCSPDGTQFVFDSDRGGDLEIYLGRYDGTEPRPLTDTEGENFHPVWSPDGSKIAFVSSRTGDNDIWVMDNGGGNPHAVTTLPGSDQHPQWSPDGRWLYYASNREGQFDIYRYDFDTREETRLTQTETRDETAPAFFDSTTLVYIAEIEAGNSVTGALWVDDGQQARPAVSAEGRVDQPVWITSSKVLLSADLGGITQILLVDLVEATRSILTNIGPRNFWPHPCYVQSDEISAVLPTGIPPTLTPTPVEERISAFTPVLNPATDWKQIRNTFDAEELTEIEDDRLQNADISDQLIIYQWTQGGDEYSVTLLPEIVDGALEVSITSYTKNGQPEDLLSVQDIAFLVREYFLAETIPPGTYRAESLNFEGDTIMLVLSSPSQ